MIPCHTELLPGRNVYQTSWFILSVLILTGGEMSVFATHDHGIPRHRDSTLVGMST